MSRNLKKRQISLWGGGGVGSFICTRTYKEWMFLIVLFSTGCQIADMWRTFFIWSILGILLTKDHWIPMIQKNSHLTSLKRNYVTPLYSVRNHFLTDGFKTIHTYMKSTADSTIILLIKIFFSLSAFFRMHWI